MHEPVVFLLTRLGPHPETALQRIDRMGLYNTVFTNPTDVECVHVDTTRWSLAYGHLLNMLKLQPEESSSPSKAFIGKLLRDSDEVFLAWMLVCFIPWAKIESKPSKKLTSKQPPSPASLAAREGIKADNKICKIVDDAVHSLQDVINLKDSFIESKTDDSTRKRKLGMDDRAMHGQAIRQWGSHWRCNAIFALLTQISEGNSSTGKSDLLVSITVLTR